MGCIAWVEGMNKLLPVQKQKYEYKVALNNIFSHYKHTMLAPVVFKMVIRGGCCT